MRQLPADNGDYVFDGSEWNDTTALVHWKINGVTSEARTVMQVGIGRVINTAGPHTIAVTFPRPFASCPHVDASILGVRATGAAFNPLGLIGIGTDQIGSASKPSLTGCEVTLRRTGTGAMPDIYDYYYSVLAVGVLA